MTDATTVQLDRRYEITANCVVTSPLAIGAADDLGLTDQLVAADGLGRPIVPGTSLAGVLRAVCTRIAGASAGDDGASAGVDTVTAWFGDIGEDGHASRVIVDDAVLCDPTVEIRDGVGIDRASGTAAEHFKYTRETIASGATLRLVVTVELPVDGGATGDVDEGGPVVPGIVTWIATAISEGLALGSGTTKGYGRIELAPDAAVTVHLFDHTTRESTLAALAGGKKIEGVEPVPNPGAGARFSMAWRPLSPLFVRAGRDGNVVDDFALTTSAGADFVRFVIPGSSIKGALRSRCEWIVRTVTGADVPKGFAEQMDVPLVDVLFGAPARHDDPNGRTGGRAALTVAECRTTKSLPRDTWRTITTMARPDEKRTARLLDELIELIDGTEFAGQLEPVQHVAIDRWTGSPSDGALFSTLELATDAWEPIVCTLDVAHLERRLARDHHLEGEELVGARNAALFLLLLGLRDLADGWVPLGFATNRGGGSLEMTEDGLTIVTGDGWGDHRPRLPEAIPPGFDVDAGEFETAWKAWVDTHRSTGAAS